MNRRARLRLRGISLLDGALRRKLRPGATEAGDSGAWCRGSCADISIEPSPKGTPVSSTRDTADTAVSAERVDERDVAGPRGAGMGRTDARLQDVDVAWSAAGEPAHGRALRALRTARARRLAIALGLAHGARLE